MTTEQEIIPENSVLGRWWQTEQGAVRCELCPRRCLIRPGKRGFCYIRAADETAGGIYLTSYGRSSGFCIDPIEKKPLNHFYPGSSVLTFGTAGCNLGCRYCQNWDISKARSWDRLAAKASPDQIVATAAAHQCKSIAFSYNDPIIFAEYAIDCARKAREQQIKTVAVTSAYISKAAREEFFSVMDAINVDLKSFREDFYQRLCLAHLQPILDNLIYIRQKTSAWLELTTLVIPGENDSLEELTELGRWVLNELGADTPLHLTAFHPDFKMTDHAPTSPAALKAAREELMALGLNYVYTGNIHDSVGSSTYCPNCKHRVIERDWYRLGESGLHHDRCIHCNHRIAGHFDQTLGDWGRRRLPIEMADA